MRGRTYVDLHCATCGRKFRRLKSEYTFQLKRAKTPEVYCSLSCRGHSPANKKHIKAACSLEARRAGGIAKHAKHPPDKQQPFRNMLRRIRNSKHGKSKGHNLTILYLEALFLKQKKKCALSHIPLTLCPSPEKRKALLTDASLDRIDSNKGYVQGNVQFVCLFVNLGKRNYENSTVIKLLQLIHRSK